MFIEFQTNEDKTISYNVHEIVFIGEMKESVSVLFKDGTHAILPDEYVNVVKKIIGLTKVVIEPSMYVQFTTKKEERIAFPIERISYILEQENSTAIMFDDGTRLEVLEGYDEVIKRINSKLDIAVIRPNNMEETKS